MPEHQASVVLNSQLKVEMRHELHSKKWCSWEQKRKKKQWISFTVPHAAATTSDGWLVLVSSILSASGFKSMCVSTIWADKMFHTCFNRSLPAVFYKYSCKERSVFMKTSFTSLDYVWRKMLQPRALKQIVIKTETGCFLPFPVKGH